MKRTVILGLIILAITGCETVNDNVDDSIDPGNEISIESSQLKLESTLSFKEGRNRVTNRLIPLLTQPAVKVEALVAVGTTSSVSQGAQIETDIRLSFQPPNNAQSTHVQYAVLRLRDEGDGLGPRVQAFVGMCLTSSCSQEVYLEQLCVW